MKERLWKLYEAGVLCHPTLVLSALMVAVAGLLLFAPEFKLDASADSLVLENDDDLKYYRHINSRYGSDDFLIITYRPSPPGDIFTPEALARLAALHDNLEALDGTDRVISILNVPLLNNLHNSLSKLSGPPRTLETPGVDLQLAKLEFTQSLLYREMLLSRDGRITALLTYLKADPRYRELLSRREQLRELKYTGQINSAQTRELRQVSDTFRAHQAEHTKRVHKYISEVRTVMDNHRDDAGMFLGGVSMIASDMISFVRSDLVNFGVAVTAFLILMLLVIFRRPRWIAMPMLCAGLAAAAMIGLLGLLDKPVTVISANFVALLLIITMSMTIHLVVRYRENQARQPDADKKELVRQTIRFMFEPCLYTTITTIAAFTSLLVSGIRPVIDFGQIMTVGTGFAFLVVFIVFPTFLMIMPRGRNRSENDFTASLTAALAHFTRKHYRAVTVAAVVAIAAAGVGVAQLKVENRFIDYFKEDTEIYQGMLTIDRNLGGTTPLDLILNAEQTKPTGDALDNGLDEAIEDDLADILGESDYLNTDETRSEYWLTPHNLERVKRLHDYFEAQPEIGKVLSLATLARLAESLNNDRPLNDFETGVLRTLLPENIKRILLSPYLSEDGRQLRFSMRVVDSSKELNRRELIERIRTDVSEKMGYAREDFRLTGMLVLYNNMLQSLYDSQILTLGVVFLAIALMFVVLFRSIALALIAIIPNLIAAELVLGFMGWRGIPLDLMTITIAAISVGIAVDNTIHYIIRFKREFVHDRDYEQAVQRCHTSIGKAVYYTSITIIAGFSILALSNFVPTMYFGLLTGLAMFAALIASLTLLPSLLIIFRPLGPSRQRG